MRLLHYQASLIAWTPAAAKASSPIAARKVTATAPRFWEETNEVRPRPTAAKMTAVGVTTIQGSADCGLFGFTCRHPGRNIAPISTAHPTENSETQVARPQPLTSLVCGMLARIKDGNWEPQCCERSYRLMLRSVHHVSHTLDSDL